MSMTFEGQNGSHLTIGVLDGGNVALAKGAFDEAQDERALADAAGAEDDHAVVVALLRHAGDARARSRRLLNVDWPVPPRGGTHW